MEYNIGDVIKDSNRDLTIIDKKLDKRTWYYKYRCNVCGYSCEDGYHGGKPVKGQWYKSRDFDTLNKGCRCCNRRITVPNINSIAMTNPELSMCFMNGDEYKYPITSNAHVDIVCPDCGHIIHDKTISALARYGVCCPVCSSSRSIGERIVYAVLECLDVDFKKEFQFKDYDYRYDFYVEDKNMIIEVHGRQHYEQAMLSWNDVKDEMENDKLKKELALSNGVKHYMEIDARESDFDYIKNSILNSDMSAIFNLSAINWNTIKEDIEKNGKIKDICEYWESHPDATIADMEIKFHYSVAIIYKYLTIGYEHGWCHKRETKPPIVKPLRYGDTYYRDCAIASRHIEDATGTKIPQSTIRYKAQRNKDFVYVSRLEFNEAYYSGKNCIGKLFTNIECA